MIKVIATHRIDNHVYGVKTFTSKYNRVITLDDLNKIRDFTLKSLTTPGSHVHIRFNMELEPNERKNTMVHSIRRDLEITYRNIGNIDNLLQTYIVEQIHRELS